MFKKTNLRLTMTIMAVISVLPSCSSSDTGSDIAPVPAIPSAPEQEVLTEADPTIFLDSDGTYYLYGTGSDSGQGFFVYRSADLKNWQGPVGKVNGFCLTGATSFGTTGFWAPQVVKRGDTYYMFYTANEQIAVATSTSPMGPFAQDEKQAIATPGKAIDPFVLFDDDGKAYLYHVRLQDGNRIFVAEMTDDLKAIKEETAKECVHATEQWENTAQASWSVTEGPTVLHIADTYYMFYSANDFRNIDYAVGVATATSPFGPWTKSQQSLINRANTGYYGTGHGDVFKDTQGNWNYVLHTHYSFTEVSPRKTAVVGLSLQGATFSVADGTFHYLYKEK
jgi:beta-xylosidase